MARVHAVGREPQAMALVGREVLEQHVGAGEERVEPGRGVGRSEVEAHPPLVRVPVEEGERPVGPLDAARERRPHALAVPLERLDAHDVGAEIREQPSGERAPQIGEVDDTEVRESGGVHAS